jgi:hypothetical protein
MVLNAQTRSAVRMRRSSGMPRVEPKRSMVAAIMASACVRLVVAATSGHFISTKAQAWSYHFSVWSMRSMEIGRPVAMTNASPRRAADVRSDRKPSAKVLLANGSFHPYPRRSTVRNKSSCGHRDRPSFSTYGRHT